MNNNYFYPLFSDWSEDELRDVCRLYMSVEQSYENSAGVNAQKILKEFQRFQTINPSKGEQKQLEKTFQQRSGYDIYATVQAALKANGRNVKMTGKR